MSAARVVSKFRPLADRVLVQKVTQQAKTSGGVFLPESAVQTINQAVVVSVGEGRLTKEGKRLAPLVKEGDKVIVPEFGGMKLKLDESDYLVFRDEDIVGVISD